MRCLQNEREVITRMGRIEFCDKFSCNIHVNTRKFTLLEKKKCVIQNFLSYNCILKTERLLSDQKEREIRSVFHYCC